ncbi:hypothetical protein [Paraburkholderia dipogonis]|uniref:hypothetical protein n=1 Tax=Paraburkholderia dipogonis TaxID=1211383 RepID=UPI0038B93275
MRKSQAEINEWISQQQDRLGIVPPRIYPNMSAARRSSEACVAPAVTIYPSPYVIERLAHAGADLLIANNPAYASMCARLDAELAEILDGGVGLPAPRVRRGKSTRTPRVLMND